MKFLPPFEAVIIGVLIDDFLGRAASISVNDEEEFALLRSTDQDQIRENVGKADQIEFFIHDPVRTIRDCFLMIHGNLEAVISDHTDNKIWKEIDQ